MTVLIPLVGACLILFAGPNEMESDSYLVFRFLLSTLIGMGIAGVAFALAVSQQLTQTVFAFTGSSTQKTPSDP